MKREMLTEIENIINTRWMNGDDDIEIECSELEYRRLLRDLMNLSSTDLNLSEIRVLSDAGIPARVRSNPFTNL